MVILAIVNQKGGVGKTTTAVTLGHGFALKGHKTLLIDLDSQGNVSDSLGLEKHGTLADFLFSDDPGAAVSETGRENLRLVASDKRTAGIKVSLAERNFREYFLDLALKKLNGYDVVVLDAAPVGDLLQVNAFIACTHYLVPASLAHLSQIGLNDTLETAASLKEFGRLKGEFVGVLPTFWERTTKESYEQLRSLADQFGRRVWPPVPRDVKAREAPAFGQTLWEYAPGTRALAGTEMSDRRVGGYQQVLERLIQEVIQ
jgi:chromosome partitioning protein